MNRREVRQVRAPYVKPSWFMRGCAACGTDFMKTEGGSEERGPWVDEKWYCSVQCSPLLPVGSGRP